MLLCGWLAAPPDRAQQPQQPEEPTTRIGVTVENVVAPVLVFDKDGSYVNNIRPDQFHLYDNTKEQNISVDVVYQPISLVIAIQANSHVEQLLPHVQKIGNLIKPLLIGDQGEAAIIRQNYAAGQEDLPWQHFQPLGRRRGGGHPDVDHAPQEPPAHPDGDRRNARCG
jgi:hypothetical protein